MNVSNPFDLVYSPLVMCLMKTRFIVSIMLLLSVPVFAQKLNIAFMSADSMFFGFKNPEGKVIAEPRFMMVGNEAFKDVVAVMEEVTTDKHSTYYLRADGTKFGVDSVYFFDQAPDIESNGFIRFKDPVSKKVGVMNVAGEIVLPAEFDEMWELRNGFVWAIRGSTMECVDKNVPLKNCEHRTWVGGEKVLYNLKGELLSRDFFSNLNDHVNLDYYTFKKSKKASKDPNRINFKAEGGGFFSFVDLDKTFDSWLKENLLDIPSESQLSTLMGDSVLVWKEETGWEVQSKSDFSASNSAEIRLLNDLLKNKKYNYFNFYQEDLFFYEFRSLFGQYFNGAYQFNHWKYPTYQMVIDSQFNRDQSHLTFLRTEKGWKLISVSIR